jgi:hypothetical protein
MKLRQKHPGTVRVADDDLGEIVQDSPLRIAGARSMSSWISSHFSRMCRDLSTFSSQHELFNILGGSASKVDSISHHEDGYEQLQRCFKYLISDQVPCICSRQVWFNWFPCTLKYCRNRDGEGEHRCGIKTCQKCVTFRFRAKSRLYCSWDEP